MKHPDDVGYLKMYFALSTNLKDDLKRRHKRYQAKKEWLADMLLEYYRIEYDDYLMALDYNRQEQHGVDAWKGLH